MASGSNSRALVLLFLTSGFFITGLLFDYMPMIVDDQIKRTVELATNEEIRSLWSRPPIDFHSYYWLYDVLNSEQFLAGEKIRVRKVGPYHLTSRFEKQIIEMSQNKFKLIYNTSRYFHINDSSGPPLANWQLDEPLTLLNPVYPAITEAIRHLSSKADLQTKSAMIASVNRLTERFNETLLRNSSAREALIGRRLILIEKARKMAATFGIDMNLPEEANPNGLFGFVALQNGTLNGPYEIYTGYQATASSLGDLFSYKGKRRLNHYSGRCNRLQASAGELRPMPLSLNQSLEQFQSSLCRIVRLKQTGTKQTKEGLAFTYILGQENFMSYKTNPDNACFCINSTVDDYCSLDGVIQLAPCSYYAPIVLSMNHIEPDIKITSNIQDWNSELISSEFDGLPTANKSAQIFILRRFGVPIQADLTITMFMKVVKDTNFRQTSNIPEITYVPLVTVRERASIPSKLSQIVVNLENLLALTYHIKVVMYLSALILLCWLAGHYCGHPNKSNITQRNSRRIRGPIQPGTKGADSLSERANSADSNRSQPPSRASRSSLDGADSADSTPESGRPTSEVTASVSASTAKSTIEMRQKSANENEDNEGETIKTSDSSNLRDCVVQKNEERNEERDKQTYERQIAESDTKTKTKTKTRSKGWFVKVCSNFVRLLNDLRSSINDVSQLDIKENDYQDKQLEMLAGKIDNWYSESGQTARDSDGPTAEATTEGQAPVSLEPTLTSLPLIIAEGESSGQKEIGDYQKNECLSEENAGVIANSNSNSNSSILAPGNQSDALDGSSIDESSGKSLKQSNKCASNELASQKAKEASEDSQRTPLKQETFPAELVGDGETLPIDQATRSNEIAIQSATKDERRDSGVKLDSRNGISSQAIGGSNWNKTASLEPEFEALTSSSNVNESLSSSQLKQVSQLGASKTTELTDLAHSGDLGDNNNAPSSAKLHTSQLERTGQAVEV